MHPRNYLILNVDDYTPGRYARTKVLRQAGFSVIEAASGAETLRLAGEHKPAVILLDVNLPDMSGFQVCRQIRQHPEIAATTILHISASSIQVAHQVHGLEAGADGYLVEPIDGSVLIATLNAHLRAREAEDALRRSNEELEAFAHRVAHDLNEPLRTMTAYAQLLDHSLRDEVVSGDVKASIDNIVAASGRMRSFVDSMLQYATVRGNRSEPAVIDCEEMMRRILANLTAAIEESHAQVRWDPLPSIYGDAELERVFQNLIGNAIKYRREGVPPEIQVSAGQADGNWVFSVRDNGIGIAPEYQDRIFRLFQRLHGREIPGNGIGLAIAKKVLDAHRGTIRVESRPGEGSTFFVTLPRVEARTAPAV